MSKGKWNDMVDYLSQRTSVNTSVFSERYHAWQHEEFYTDGTICYSVIVFLVYFVVFACWFFFIHKFHEKNASFLSITSHNIYLCLNMRFQVEPLHLPLFLHLIYMHCVCIIIFRSYTNSMQKCPPFNSYFSSNLYLFYLTC